MEPRNDSTMLESPGEDSMLIETVNNIVTRNGRNESETEENFFLASQVQAERYTVEEENVEQNTPSQKQRTVGAVTFTDLCRICANTNDHLIPIFEGVGTEHDLPRKILKYLPIHVSENDTLPLHMCYHCAAMLLAWHELSEGCLNAQRKLLEMKDSLGNKQQCNNSASLNNLDMSAPITTTSTTVTIANSVESQPNQQTDDKNEAGSAEETERSNRLQNPLTRSQKISPKAKLLKKIKDCRSKINLLQTENPNKISKNISSLTNDIASHKLTERLACANYLSSKSHSYKSTKVDIDKTTTRNTGISRCAGSLNACTSEIRTNCPKDEARNSQNELSAEKTHERNSRSPKEIDKKMTEQTERPENDASTSRPISCHFCNKKFRSRKSQWAHTRTHTGEKSYTCHVCGKQFTQGGSLYYHLKHVHDGVKNHACDICGRSFAMKTAMEDHRRIHTGERPYVCDSCGKTFKTKASLYIHGRIHTDEFPHECTYCAKRFRWRQQMLGHLTVHTGEKNHTCEICGKSFGVKNDLTRHRYVHSDEKPYTCQRCGVSFGQKRYLKSHERLKLGTCGYSRKPS